MSHKILIVEDDENINLMIQLILKNKRMNWELRSAREGREAFGVLRTFAADLVLTDLSMPNMGGVELIQAIKSDETLNCKVAVLTSMTDDSILHPVRAARVDGLWMKPITADALFANISELLK